MKKILKKLSVLMCFALITISIIGLNRTNNEIAIREIELKEQEIDYQKSLNKLSNYEITNEENKTKLEGTKTITEEEISLIQNLSDEKIAVKEYYITFEMEYDTITNIVTIYANMSNELGELEIDEIKGIGFINEKNQIDAAMNIDGEIILLSEMSESGMIENCGWFKKLVKAVVVVATVAVVTTAMVATVVVTAGVVAPALVAAGVGVATSSAVGIGTGLCVSYALYETAGKTAIEAAINLEIEIDDDFGNIIDSETLSKISKYGLTTTIITALVKEFIKDTENNTNKTVYLGVGEDEYQDVARKSEGIAYKVDTPRWNELIKLYGYEGMWLVNKAFLNYVIKKKWEIVLVSNPATYYDKYSKTILVENRFYPKELEYLNKYKLADWHYEGPYWRVDKAW